MSIQFDPVIVGPKTGRPKGSLSIDPRAKKMAAMAMRLMVERSRAQKLAIRCGIKGDYRGQAKYTAECQLLTQQITDLQLNMPLHWTDLL